MDVNIYYIYRHTQHVCVCCHAHISYVLRIYCVILFVMCCVLVPYPCPRFLCENAYVIVRGTGVMRLVTDICVCVCIAYTHLYSLVLYIQTHLCKYVYIYVLYMSHGV